MEYAIYMNMYDCSELWMIVFETPKYRLLLSPHGQNQLRISHWAS